MKESVTQLASKLSDRFELFLLSLDEACISAGKKTQKQQELEDSEQYEARRELLRVEEVANKKREEIANSRNSYVAKVEKALHDDLIVDLLKQLNNTDDIVRNILKIDGNLPKLMDTLFTEACSISRLVSIIEQIPWLEKSIIQFIRQPKYRRLDSQGHPLIVKTLRGALSFVGIESLRQLIPVLVAKHFMPSNSEFIPDMQKHLWMFTMGTANVAKAIGPSMSVRANFAYVSGLYHLIGRSVIATLYLRLFDVKLREWVIECRKQNDPVKARTLVTLVPSQHYLAAYWKKHSASLTAQIVEKMRMRWVMVSPGFDDYARIREISWQRVQSQNLHPLAQVLFKSQGYMQFKLLQKNHLISKDAAMLFLRNFGINADDMSLLSGLNLTSLDISIAGNLIKEE